VELQTILCRVDKIEETQIQHERSIDNLNDKTEEITIDGGNRRKPQTYRKSLTNFIT
jgi:hypothetical protein